MIPARINGSAPFARAVLDGLAQPQKRIPCEWLYDRRGSELFELITELPEYYPTRTEIALLRQHAGEIADAVGNAAVVVEIGSGSSRKTPLLLGALDQPQAYVPVDIAAHCLDAAVRRLRADFAEFNNVALLPLLADFNAPLSLPAPLGEAVGTKLGFFPGSTIGNLDPDAALAFLQRMAGTLGARGMMLIGVDMTADADLLIPAYDDAAGVTAAFNLNLLQRANRELEADFAPAAFRHQARYDRVRGRVEMHLVSRWRQTAQVLGERFDFAEGESIHTENSYKYPIADFQALAGRAGWSAVGCWCDARQRFSLHLLRRADAA